MDADKRKSVANQCETRGILIHDREIRGRHCGLSGFHDESRSTLILSSDPRQLWSSQKWNSRAQTRLTRARPAAALLLILIGMRVAAVSSTPGLKLNGEVLYEKSVSKSRKPRSLNILILFTTQG
jgi:hypothetical protein